jgi:hypothetical protein
VVYWIAAALAGILVIVAAMLLPQSSPMIVIRPRFGTGYIAMTAPFHSIMSTCFPVGLGLLVAFLAAAFAPAYGHHVLQRRVVASVVFAVSVALAGFIDLLASSRWFLQYGPSLEWPASMSWDFSVYTSTALWTLNPANWPLVLLQSLALAPLWALFVFAMSFVGDIVFGLFSITPLNGIYD